ncbi:hypothetical protein AU377_00870 [Sporosarcina sp. HYO08]|nr:hypothetical protein AU377_00870 [Sporosarcina sp. HYO08]
MGVLESTSPKAEANISAVQKRSGKPFTPTEVPSPIYGFNVEKRAPAFNPLSRAMDDYMSLRSRGKEIEKTRVEVELEEGKHQAASSIVQEEVKEVVVRSVDELISEKDSVLNSIETKIEENEELDERLEEEHTESFDKLVVNEVEIKPAIEDFESEELLDELQDIVVKSENQATNVEQITQPVEEEQALQKVIEEQEALSIQEEMKEQEIEEQFSVQKERMEDPIVADANEEVSSANLPAMTREVEEQIVASSIETAEPIVEKKERVIPFNVIMLKSDKEKLALREQQTTAKAELASTKEAELSPQQLDLTEEKIEAVTEAERDTVEEVEEEPYYALPSLDFLVPPESQIEDLEWLESQSEKLEESLSHFSVQATVIEAVQGPTVTRFELTVGQGTKVSKVRNLTDDLKLALAAEDIRIQAPIPGRSSIGIEIPNRQTRAVRISEVINTEQFKSSTSPLEAVLGLSLTGKPVTLDLRKMPHGMIAGATGSGKSVCINSILVSLLYKASPTDLKMMLIDPKMVELAPFNGIPHLISPVITDVKAATAALKWAVAEMERRYELLAHAGVRDIERYNKAVIEDRRFSLKMPYLLIVIDELADLMMMAPNDVEVSISRIAQKARACGIHLIIATQRPSVDVITGLIKANVPTRIAFSVSSQVDSRTIIDTPGADRLLGKGDMLYIGNGKSSPVRLQGTFVTDDEIERIIEHVRNEAEPDYLFGQEDLLANAIEEEETDPLFEEACQFVVEQGSASTSLLQRNFSIGYNRAAKLIDRMEKNGFISGQRGSKARDVYASESDLAQFFN